ncbi:uncharacterized protein [Littorina saxatilis]|uniref:uncharacterized protein n=1 Tax=Littorina saxatilis TaxID=31220 RepID=UPI0038B63367
MLMKATVLAIAVLGTAKVVGQNGLVHVECPRGIEGVSTQIIFIFNTTMLKYISGQAFMHIRKAGTSDDILHCSLKDTSSQWECKVVNDNFQSKGLVKSKLTLVILNVTNDLQGPYELRVIFNNTDTPPVTCNFTVKSFSNEDETKQEDHTVIYISSAVGVLFLILLTVFAIWIVLRKKRTRHFPQSQDMPAKRLIESNKSWYFGKLKRTDERRLLAQHGNNSFLIRDSRAETNVRVLAVNSCGTITYLKITRDGNSFCLHKVDSCFWSLTDLVDYYQYNDIKTTDGKVVGKLLKPCTWDTQEDQGACLGADVDISQEDMEGDY